MKPLRSLRRIVLAKLPTSVRSMLREALVKVHHHPLGTARRKARGYIANSQGRAVSVNLGCGAKPLAGWLNIDEVRFPSAIAFDLRKGLPMLAAESVDLIYHEHFLEHLDRRSGSYLIQESFRVLKRGATMRIAMPDLDLCIRNYLAGWPNQDHAFIEERKFLYGDQLLDTPGEGLDLALRGWGHKFLYGERDLVRLLELNEFTHIHRVGHGVSEVPGLSGLETRGPEQSALIVEAQK